MTVGQRTRNTRTQTRQIVFMSAEISRVGSEMMEKGKSLVLPLEMRLRLNAMALPFHSTCFTYLTLCEQNDLLIMLQTTCQRMDKQIEVFE